MQRSEGVPASGRRRCEIHVEPTGSVWRVRRIDTEEEATFASGWEAEMAARKLARSLADAGRSSAIRVYIRGGELAGTHLSGPDEPLSH